MRRARARVVTVSPAETVRSTTWIFLPSRMMSAPTRSDLADRHRTDDVDGEPGQAHRGEGRDVLEHVAEQGEHGATALAVVVPRALRWPRVPTNPSPVRM